MSHLAARFLKNGVGEWNAWRNASPDIIPNLQRIDLRGKNLRGVDFSNAHLFRANLAGADLRDANLYQAELYGADLTNCDFRDCDLRGAKCHNAIMRGCVFEGADLFRCSFIQTDLTGASLAGARCDLTAFASVDLCEIEGLTSVIHMAPSCVDLLTISKSIRRLPFEFLSAAGTSQAILDGLRRAGTAPVKSATYNSCFISYSSADQDFATTLYRGLRAAGIAVWYAPEDMRPGKKVKDQIERAIFSHDRLILVLSKASIQSGWVLNELRSARRREQSEERSILFPIRLCSMEELKRWEFVDSDMGWDLAAEVRGYHVADFTDWANEGTFAKQLKAVIEGLEAAVRSSGS